MANHKFQNAINRVAQNCPPIWFMRQAGRYHQHYQNIRKSHSFMDMCKKPELATEVLMGPIEDFDFDVAILFSDLLFPLEGLGMGLEYNPAPSLKWLLNKDTISQLRTTEQALEAVEFQKETVAASKAALPENKSLIGFVGSPWTLFVYAVKGTHKGDFQPVINNLDLYAPFCDIVIPLLKQNIQWQLESGAEIVMLFDTAAGNLSPEMFKEYVVPTVEPLASAHPDKTAYYSKNTTPEHLAHPLFQSANLFAGIGYDQHWNLPEVLQSNTHGFVQGNFNQDFMPLENSAFMKELEKWIKPIAELSPQEREGWVCGLGHGMMPTGREENVRSFVKTIREVFASE